MRVLLIAGLPACEVERFESSLVNNVKGLSAAGIDFPAGQRTRGIHHEISVLARSPNNFDILTLICDLEGKVAASRRKNADVLLLSSEELIFAFEDSAKSARIVSTLFTLQNRLSVEFEFLLLICGLQRFVAGYIWKQMRSDSFSILEHSNQLPNFFGKAIFRMVNSGLKTSFLSIDACVNLEGLLDIFFRKILNNSLDLHRRKDWTDPYTRFIVSETNLSFLDRVTAKLINSSPIPAELRSALEKLAMNSSLSDDAERYTQGHSEFQRLLDELGSTAAEATDPEILRFWNEVNLKPITSLN